MDRDRFPAHYIEGLNMHDLEYLKSRPIQHPERGGRHDGGFWRTFPELAPPAKTGYGPVPPGGGKRRDAARTGRIILLDSL
jgi:hypothetical protein